MKHFSNIFKVTTIGILFFVVLVVFFSAGKFLEPFLFGREKTEVAQVKPQKTIKANIEPTATSHIGEEIKANTNQPPAKPRASAIKSSSIAGKTVSNSNGNRTVIVAEGNVSTDEMQSIGQSGPSGSDPYSIKFIDETGRNGGLEKSLKDYLNNKLKWGAEISHLYGIKLLDAGDTGWAGQYAGSYTIASNGEVSNAFGWINLNIYYYKSSPYLSDYMKLVLSHEYGHHYTLYYKWTKWKLLSGTRFPDNYYAVRPLGKTSTTFDYSLGWENCDAEIIAEDYAYIYSGYGLQAMSGKYGFPALPATTTWLTDGLVNGRQETDSPPNVVITSPSNGVNLSGTVNIIAEASDDKKVARVVFYVGGEVVAENSTTPYIASFNTLRFANGSHILKAIAYDEAGQTNQNTITVTFENIQPDLEKPNVQIIEPASDPYSWIGQDLRIEASASDNIQVIRLEIYINDYKVATEDNNIIIRIWPFDNAPAGTYVLKIKAYDAAGNYNEKSLVINKS
ncbi:MAG: Ig-like domain-containing protein [bacterium]|nr:Ig-like domain-containing protein [bacterium]